MFVGHARATLWPRQPGWLDLQCCVVVRLGLYHSGLGDKMLLVLAGIYKLLCLLIGTLNQTAFVFVDLKGNDRQCICFLKARLCSYSLLMPTVPRSDCRGQNVYFAICCLSV